MLFSSHLYTVSKKDLLDFKVSDYSINPIPLYFFHVNGRHHSFALVGSNKIGFHHFMVEYKNLDDVVQVLIWFIIKTIRVRRILF